MGICCAADNNPESEKTKLLAQDKQTQNEKILTDSHALNNEHREQEEEVRVYKTENRNVSNIHSIENNHIHKQITGSLFINHWFRKLLCNDTIPQSVMFIILNYVIQQRITSLVYIDTHHNNETFNVD
eukprot:85724_1